MCKSLTTLRLYLESIGDSARVCLDDIDPHTELQGFGIIGVIDEGGGHE